MDKIRALDRLTGVADVELLLDLGEVPIGGVYWNHPAERPLRTAPLRWGRSRSTGHVQLMDRYDSSLYQDYTFSGYSSETYERHVRGVAGRLVESVGTRGRVFEVGASDGLFLKVLQHAGFEVSGVEPASALAESARKDGLNVQAGYFSADYAVNLVQSEARFDGIVLRHVLEHLDDPNTVFEGFNHLSGEDSWLLVELPALEGILSGFAFSSIFHEHVSYFSAPVLWSFLQKWGWGVQWHELVPVHGQSHLVLCRKGPHRVSPTPLDEADLQRFIHEVHEWKTQARKLFDDERRDGRRVVGWGASHRTPGLMALCGILDLDLQGIVDSNRLLHGLFQPPMSARIVAPSELEGLNPDTVVIFAISYQNEIRELLDEFVRRGGRVIGLAGRLPRVLE